MTNSKPSEVTSDPHDSYDILNQSYYMYHIIWLVSLESVKPYLGRVRERAEARIEAYLKEHEEEEKAKRIEASPGGLGQVQTKII